MTSFKDHKEWIKDNNIHQDLFDEEYDFSYKLINSIQPTSILVVGGYYNLDLFFAVQGLKDNVYVVNVDPCIKGNKVHHFDNIEEVHTKLKEHFNFRGTYIFKKANQRKWDIIWDNGVTLSYANLFKNQTLIYYHYGNPAIILNTLPQLDKHFKIQAFSRSLAYFGNIKENINEALGYDGYQMNIISNPPTNYYITKYSNSRIFWEHNEPRLLPYIGNIKEKEM